MRPVLVMSNNKINNSEKVVVVCITDAKGKVNARCLPIQDSWFLLYSDTEDEEKQVIPGRTIPASMHTYEFLDKDSMIQCEEIRAVSKARLDANRVLWSSIFVTLMANKIGGLQFGIYRNCQISSRVFHTAVAALPLTKANRSDFE